MGLLSIRFSITLFTFIDHRDNDRGGFSPTTIIREVILMTSQNIEALVDKALSICREQRFAGSSVHGKHKIFKAIIRKHKEKGFDAYNESVLLEYIQEQRDRFEKGLMVKDAFTFKEKTALQLKELVDSGTIDYGKVNRPLGLTDYYSGIIDKMLVFTLCGIVSSGTQKNGSRIYFSSSFLGGNIRTRAVISPVLDKSRPP